MARTDTALLVPLTGGSYNPAHPFRCQVARVLKQILVVGTLALTLAACGKNGLNNNPLRVTRSACPAVAIVQNTGDVTLFAPAASRDASAIDVVATITNLRSTCTDAGSNIVTQATFDVIARRTNGSGAREVTLPYFSAVVQAGDRLIAKQTGSVALRFADGQTRATASGTARGDVARTAATLPEDIRAKIERKRKPDDIDAALDPLAEPSVRAAVREASFELLVGFQLDTAAFAYNVTK
jgi:hypothetical protein